MIDRTAVVFQDLRPEWKNDGSETVAEHLSRLDAWRANGEWIPACGRSETEFKTRTGRRLLYCYQPRTGRHAYLDCDTDLILTDEEARVALEH